VLSYVFEAIDDDLGLMPLAARRAADAAGLRPSLGAWRSLGRAEREALTRAGQEPRVDVARVSALLAAARPEPEVIAPVPEPPTDAPPSELVAALGPTESLPAKAWSALDALGRYALLKVATRAGGERLSAAYQEIVGESARVLHLDATGAARMVSVSEKAASTRRAVARSRVGMNAEAFARLERADAPKGDVLGTARIAGIQGAKRTSDLVPLCHPIAITRVEVRLELDAAARAVDITATVEAFDRTGVEMEALTAASTAALTVYDMLKAFDRGMQIGPTLLAEKSGGRSGDFRAPERGVRFDVREIPLSVDEAIHAVSRPEAGGIVVFLGTVRDHNAGQSVTLLEYQAYASMAVREMERIGAELEAEHEGVRVSALHRAGALAVGDLAVVCAASAPHRDEAFRAARALIDRVKASVPIWKREHGTEGPYWINWQDARVGGST